MLLVWVNAAGLPLNSTLVAPVRLDPVIVHVGATAGRARRGEHRVLTTGPLAASDPSANAVAVASPLSLTVRPVNVRAIDVLAELMTVTDAVSVASL